MKKLFFLVAVVLLFMPSLATAQSCYNVMTVNGATIALGSNVSASMAAQTAELVALNQLQAMQILSAVKVGVAQSSASAGQVATATVKSNEAASSAYVASRQNSQVLEATDRYMSLGYKPCDYQIAMKQFHQNYKAANAAKTQNYQDGVIARPGVITDPGPWFRKLDGSSKFDASSLFGSDQQSAKDYMNAVVGPPDNIDKGRASSAEGSMYLANKLQRDTRKSAAIFIMSQIATENTDDGPKKALGQIMETWIGKDGGAAWAAAMAGEHERGILMDAVRLEAVNVAILSYESKMQMRNELAIAAYALSRADNIINKRADQK